MMVTLLILLTWGVGVLVAHRAFTKAVDGALATTVQPVSEGQTRSLHSTCTALSLIWTVLLALYVPMLLVGLVVRFTLRK